MRLLHLLKRRRYFSDCCLHFCFWYEPHYSKLKGNRESFPGNSTKKGNTAMENYAAMENFSGGGGGGGRITLGGGGYCLTVISRHR